MWPGSRPILSLLGVALACQGPASETTGFTTVTPTTEAPASTGEGTGTTATPTSSSTAAASAGGSSPTTAEPSTSAATSAATSDTEGMTTYDVGSDKDLGDPKPAGCEGKIDFLFVLSRHTTMVSSQEKLLAAFPKFIETIEATFADFDFHVMVVDGDKEWGLSYCTQDCPALDCKVGEPCCPVAVCPMCKPPTNLGDPCCAVPDYPCEFLDQVTSCDLTLGAGNVFAAGAYATNHPCPLAGGRRYLTKEETDPVGAFTCVAKLGTSGYELMGEALTSALSPALSGPGGCNEGFLREDALLMVTFIGGYDYDSKGDPSSWATAVLDAKHGDPDAVVMLNILDPACPPYDRVCELVKMFPYHMIAGADDDFAAAFDAASGLVATACAEFIPG